MQKFLFRNLAMRLFCFLLSFGLGAQSVVPVLDSVSKGTYPTHIWMQWSYDFKKYPSNEVNFVVQRKTLVNPTKGKFSKITIVSQKAQRGSIFQDRTNDLKVRTCYSYQIKAVWKDKESTWSNEEYGFLKESKSVGTAMLYEPEQPHQLTWSAVQGATGYRLQIIEQIQGQAYNQDPDLGFYNVPLLKDTVLKETQYNWTGQQKAILWSVQVINGPESGYFPHPLHADSAVQYGSNSGRDSLLKWVALNSTILSFLVQNPTQAPLMDLNIGIYLSKQPIFDVKESVLAKNRPIYLPPQKGVGFSETLQLTGYQYIHLVPVQSGWVLKPEIETIPIR